METELKESQGEKVVTLEGEITVQRTGELKEVLMTALETGDRVRVDLQRVTEVDLSCLQLLCSAHRTAVGWNKLFAVGLPQAEAFDRTAERAGLRRHIGCPRDIHRTCLWSGGQR